MVDMPKNPTKVPGFKLIFVVGKEYADCILYRGVRIHIPSKMKNPGCNTKHCGVQVLEL